MGDKGVDGRIILKRILQEWNVKMWSGYTWLKLRSNCGLL